MCRIPIDGPLQNSSEYILVSSRPVTKLVHFNHLTQTYIVRDLGLKYAIFETKVRHLRYLNLCTKFRMNT